MIQDVPKVEDEKNREGRREAFNVIVMSLVASLLVVGTFALCAFVFVSAILG